MSASSRPLATLAGAGFCLLGIAGTLATPSAPEFVDSPAAIAKFYTENDGALLVSNSLYLLAGALLLVFAAALRSALHRAEDGDGTLATMAFGGVIATAALFLAGNSLDIVAALRVDEQGSIAPESAAVLWDGSTVLFGLAAPMAAAVGVLATAVVALRTKLLPLPLTAISFALGAALLVPPINYIAIIVFTFWCLATGLALYLRPAGAPTVGRAAVPAAA